MKSPTSQLFWSILLFCSFSIVLNAQEKENDYYPPSAKPDRIMLTLTQKPDRSMAVNWRSDTTIKKAYVHLAIATAAPILHSSETFYEAKTESFESNKSIANYHSAIMSDLLPDTKYAYRVGNEKHWSEWSHFKTAPLKEKAVSFIYFGDAQNDVKSMWSRMVRGAYSKMPKADFMLHAGDLINRANRDEEWGEWFYAGDWIYRMMPSIATPGNHEYYRDSPKTRALSLHWKPTFTLPENGPKGLEETVYYINYQDLCIISLNSQAFLLNKEDSISQVRWLKDKLKRNKKKWVIVTMHHPIFSSSQGRDNPNLRDALKPIFEEYKVDLVLQGHDHTYGRGSNLLAGKKQRTLDGPIYVVSVSGPKMYTSGLGEWMQRGAANTQLYQIIKVEGDILRFEAYTATDELYDAFELQKQRKGRNEFVDLAPKEMKERLEIPPRYESNMSKQKLEIYRKRFKAYKERKKANK